MVVSSDSYMGMFLPDDISNRISMFIDSKIDFPFLLKEDISGVFYIYGKNYKVSTALDILSATNIAKKTMEQISKEVYTYYNNRNMLTSEFIRENYTKRALQISIDIQRHKDSSSIDLKKRISEDPTILSNCFTQHIAYYKQDFFFKIFKPFKNNQIPERFTNNLLGRMLMLGFNVSSVDKLPYSDSLIPFLDWMKKF